MTEPYMTAEEVAEMLKMDERWVYDAVRMKDMPAHRPPGSRLLRFRASEVQEWFERGSTPTPSAPRRRRKAHSA